MIYLIEIEALDPSNELVTRYFGTAAYLTEPTDDLPNVEFVPKIRDAGNYERHMFGPQRTMGDGEVGSGIVSLLNAEGDLDEFLDFALDGRAIRIWGLDSVDSPWDSRVTVLEGTMEQAMFPSRRIEIRLRDRLALLREPVLTEKYLGTTISGGRADAEGGVDLKDVKKPKLFGRRRNIQPVEIDSYSFIYQIASNGPIRIERVLDEMVPRTFTQNVATLAQLKALTLTGGQYATCEALGMFRLATRTVGTLTADAYEGATLADRSAARIVQRIIGTTGTLSLADFDALHAAAPAEQGLYVTGEELDKLSASNAVLRGVGGYLSADRFGVYRTGKLRLPQGAPVASFDRSTILESGEAITRLATVDEGDGLPVWRITIRYAYNDTVLRVSEINTAASLADKLFAEQQWRQVVVENQTVKDRHPLAPEIIIDTMLRTEADAQTFANEQMVIRSSRRDLFSLRVPGEEATALDLDKIVEVALPRFGMQNGRLLRIIGITATHGRNVTSFEAWG